MFLRRLYSYLLELVNTSFYLVISYDAVTDKSTLEKKIILKS